MSSVLQRSLPGASILALTLTLLGCKSQHHVIAATGTIIGLEVGQSAATGSPAVKLGYDRAELAYVPTNRVAHNGTATGSEVSTDVLMELRYSNEGPNAGIYQRLAVGRNAVQQAGASVMFAKDQTGKLDDKAAAAIAAANKNIETLPESKAPLARQQAQLAEKFSQALPEKQTEYHAAARAAGYTGAEAFKDFIGDSAVTQAKIDAVKTELKNRNINP